LRDGSADSIAFWFTISPLLARFERKGPNGVFRWNVTCVGPVASTLSIASYSGAYELAVFGFRIRSNV
jgi:hypothetical protein